MKHVIKLFSLVAITLVGFIGTAQAAWNVKPGWVDSVEVGGKCYCKSNFDHGIANKTYRGYKIKDICDAIGRAPGGGTPYNDIQCGNGPANTERDERECPGRVDRRRCEKTKGPKWDFAKVERVLSGNANRNSNQSSPTPSNTNTRSNTQNNSVCFGTGKNQSSAQSHFRQTCKGQRQVDCDPANRRNTRSGGWVCANRNISDAQASSFYSQSNQSASSSRNSNTNTNTSNQNRGECSARGQNLGNARQNENNARAAFNQSCPGQRIKDCDPLNRRNKNKGSIWICSTQQLNY